jgi:hypothetical protein
MAETASAVSRENEDHVPDVGNGAVASGRRLLRRPTTSETERIVRGCPPEGLSIPVIVNAIRQETGCSRVPSRLRCFRRRHPWSDGRRRVRHRWLRTARKQRIAMAPGWAEAVVPRDEPAS